MSAFEPWGLEVVSSILDIIERREAALLSWGIVDGGFSQDEIESLVGQGLQEAALDAGDALDLTEELEEAGLLYRTKDGGNELWRSRSAETVRLLARLRQLFPKRNDPTGDWQSGATLVSDFRYVHRPRIYPRRHIKPAQAVDAFSSDQVSGLAREALTHLLGGRFT